MSKLGCNLRKSPGSVGSGKPSWGGKAPHLAEKGGALGSAERAGGGGARRQTTSPPTRHLTLAGVGSGALRPLIFSEIVHLGVRRPTNNLGTDLGSQSLCRHMATGDKYSCLCLLSAVACHCRSRKAISPCPPVLSTLVSAHLQLCPQVLETVSST